MCSLVRFYWQKLHILQSLIQQCIRMGILEPKIPSIWRPRYIHQPHLLFSSIAMIHLYVFVGLGFMFSYLRFHRWMSLATVLFASMFAMQFYILYSSFWAKAFISNIKSYLFAWNNQTNGGLNFSDPGTYIYNFEYFLRSIKCAFAICISLGVVIGKIDAFQTFILAIIAYLFLIKWSLYLLRSRSQG